MLGGNGTLPPSILIPLVCALFSFHQEAHYEQTFFDINNWYNTDDNYYITKGKNYYFVKSDID